MKYITKSAILVASFALFSSCGEKEKKEEIAVCPVKYEEVTYSNANQTRTFNGSAQTEKTINLSFRNTGIVTQLNMRLGQRVQKGQLLAQLDNIQSRLAYEQALTQVNSSESQMNTMKLNLNRVRSLYEKGSASLSDFENAKNGFKSAQQAYKASKRGLDIQAEQIKFGYIYAPASGIIASVDTEVDENVNPGQVIGTLNAGKTMEITLGLPESIINKVHEDMPVKIHFSALKDQNFEGKVIEIAPSLNPNTATYPVKVDILNPTEKIKSGMDAEVTFQFGKQTVENEKLIVPTNVVGEDSNGNFVFLLIGESDTVTVKKQKVTIGELTTEGFEIKEGIKSGDKIATAGLQTLLDGQKVKLDK